MTNADPDRDRPLPDPETLADADRAAADALASGPRATELILMPVDPHRLHATWHVHPDDLAEARRRLGDDGPLVLRLYDATPALPAGSDRAPPFDVAVSGLENRWYVDVWQPGRSYVAELGLRAPRGGLVRLAASRRVDLPSAAPEAAEDRTFPEPTPPRGGMAPATPQPAPEAPAGPEAAPADAVPAGTGGDGTAAPPDEAPAGVGPPTPQEPAHAGAEPPCAETGPPLSETPPEPPADRSGFPRVDDQVLQDFAARAREAESRFLGGSAAGGEPAGEAGLFPPGATGAPLPEDGGPMPLESVMSLSSFGLAGENVDLEVNAEVVIHGRARPGSRLTLFGQQVPLRPDGSFEVRRALPQGALVLPLLLNQGNG